MVAHTGPLLGGEQVPYRGGGVRHRPGPIGRRRIGDVDDRLDTGQGLIEPVTGRQIHPERPVDAHGVVPVPFEGVDGEGTDVPGRAGNSCSTQVARRLVE